MGDVAADLRWRTLGSPSILRDCADARRLGPQSLVAAVQADTLSLTAFEIGLFGWMAITQMVLFQPSLEANGYFTSFPVNWWLIARGIKERM